MGAYEAGGEIGGRDGSIGEKPGGERNIQAYWVGLRGELENRMPVGIVFSLDYEIHGNGDGSPHRLMVEPTWRMLRQFDRVGAKLTIFAEVGEILCFKRHLERSGRDDFRYREIVEQLQYAVRRGHDVQLHLHPSYLGAVLRRSRWTQDCREYDLAQLTEARLRSMVGLAKVFLEDTLRRARPDFHVYAFRAGHWAVMPTHNVAAALIANGIIVESSVFKGGQRNRVSHFDFRDAHSNLLPWRADRDNICREDPSSPLWEFPIYCEMRPLWAFFSVNRFYRALLSWTHRMEGATLRSDLSSTRSSTSFLERAIRTAFRRQPWKADFNLCSSAQLIRVLERVQEAHGRSHELVPFVMIGHSKLYNWLNERELDVLLAFARERPEQYQYCTYMDFLVNDRSAAGALTG